MSVDPNDPRLTAYALGELDDESDRSVLQAEIESDPEALAFVEAIREMAGLLTDELRKEPAPTGVTDLDRRIERELTAAATPATIKLASKGGSSLPWARYALAAGLLALMGGTAAVVQLGWLTPARDRVELAMATDAAPAAPSPKPAGPAFAPAPRSAAPETAPAAGGPAEMPPPGALAAPLAPAPDTGGDAGKIAMLAKPVAPAKPSAPSQPAPAPVATQGGAVFTGVNPPTDPGTPPGRSLALSTSPAPSIAGGMPGGTAAMPTPAPMYGGGGGRGTMGGGQGGLGGGMAGMGLGQGGQAAGLPQIQSQQYRGRGGDGAGTGRAFANRGSGAMPPAPAQSTTSLARSVGGKPSTDFEGKPQLSKLDASAAPQPGGNKTDRLGLETGRDGTASKSLKEMEGLEAKKKEAGAPANRLEDLAEVNLERRKQAEAENGPGKGGEQFAAIVENVFQPALGNQLSTFSVDVDTAAYANVRRYLSMRQRPPKDAVRIEEMINYFPYSDPAPTGEHPFSVNVEIAACPWNTDMRLARVALKGRTVDPGNRPSSNLVFLIDVSGSMSDLNKLPLLKAGMKLLVQELTENDRVAIVVYASDVRVVLPSTPCHDKKPILTALDKLQAGGSTAGGAGIELAYKEAVEHFIKGGTNRVILATDGDFNVGLSQEELLKRSEERAKSGVFLTVLGFGEGNLQEAFMEQLADKGNGHYSYIDSIAEARKVLVREMSGTLVTIAKDVKIQVEFNPAKVSSYRLIGYENRVMANQDFRNDKKDAGEIGAGHGVTALYELIPADSKAAQAAKGQAANDKPLKYGNAVPAPTRTPAPAAVASPETMTVSLRYKAPDGDKAKEFEVGVVDKGLDFGRASADFKFTTAVAGFGLLLRDSPFKGSATFSGISEIAASVASSDPSGYRADFVNLVKKAQEVYGQ